MKLEHLLSRITYDSVTGPVRGDVRGVVCDSRRVRPGLVFVAVPGLQTDGWRFAGNAVKRGAVALVTEHDTAGWPNLCTVRVANAARAVGQLAAAFHGRPADNLEMIGITGTNGKTTTAYMTRNILSASGRRPGLLSTVAYEIGARSIPAGRTTPEATFLQSMLAEMVDTGCKSGVMEVSSHALVQHRCEGIEFDVGVFTNLTRDHLDYHETMENYFQAKSRLFYALGRGRKAAVAVVNRDDAWGQRLLALGGLYCDSLTYGMTPQADVTAERLDLQDDRTTFTARTPWGRVEINMSMLGRYNVSNALAAAGACGALGVDIETIGWVLSEIQSVRGRLEEIETGRGFQVFVDYAHTDDALENVLKTLREITRKRLILVFGCGGNRDATKRPAMGRVADRFADYTLITSDNPRREDPETIIAQIASGFSTFDNHECLTDRRHAIARAVGFAAEGDVLLVAGKGHESFQELADTTVPFDDRQVLAECLAQSGEEACLCCG